MEGGGEAVQNTVHLRRNSRQGREIERSRYQQGLPRRRISLRSTSDPPSLLLVEINTPRATTIPAPIAIPAATATANACFDDPAPECGVSAIVGFGFNAGLGVAALFGTVHGNGLRRTRQRREAKLGRCDTAKCWVRHLQKGAGGGGGVCAPGDHTAKSKRARPDTLFYFIFSLLHAY